MEKERLRFLDLYKFAGAVIIACFLHYKQILLGGLGLEFTTGSRCIAFLMSNKTNSVVEFFFVISGVLFAFAYMDKISQSKLYFAEFYDARLKRLLPLVIITTVLMFVLHILCWKLTSSSFYPGNYSPNGFISLNDFVSSVLLCDSTMVQSRVNAPAWYIADLLLCYAVAWGLVRVRPYLGKITFFLPLILGVVIQNTDLNILFFNYNFSRSYIAFFAGIILGRFLSMTAFSDRKWKIFWGGGAVICIIAVCFLENYIVDRSLVVSTMLFPPLILLGYSSDLLNKICDSKVIKKLGEISFDIYLWNFPVLILFYMLFHVCQFSINSYLGWILVGFTNVAAGFLSAEGRIWVRQKIKL